MRAETAIDSVPFSSPFKTASSPGIAKSKGYSDRSKVKKPYKVEYRRNCDACVLKKIKCDGHQSCEFCTRKGLTCVFSAKRKPGPRGNSPHSPANSTSTRSRHSNGIKDARQNLSIDSSIFATVSNTSSEQDRVTQFSMPQVNTNFNERSLDVYENGIPQEWLFSMLNEKSNSSMEYINQKTVDTSADMLGISVVDHLSQSRSSCDETISSSWNPIEPNLSLYLNEAEPAESQWRVNEDFDTFTDNMYSSLLETYDKSAKSDVNHSQNMSKNLDCYYGASINSFFQTEAARKSALFGTFQASDLLKVNQGKYGSAAYPAEMNMKSNDMNFSEDVTETSVNFNQSMDWSNGDNSMLESFPIEFETTESPLPSHFDLDCFLANGPWL